MDEIKFNADQDEFVALQRKPKREFDLPGKLVQWGIVSDRQQAGYMLLGAVVVALIAAWWIWSSSGPSPVELPVEPLAAALY